LSWHAHSKHTLTRFCITDKSILQCWATTRNPFQSLHKLLSKWVHSTNKPFVRRLRWRRSESESEGARAQPQINRFLEGVSARHSLGITIHVRSPSRIGTPHYWGAPFLWLTLRVFRESIEKVAVVGGVRRTGHSEGCCVTHWAEAWCYVTLFCASVVNGEF